MDINVSLGSPYLVAQVKVVGMVNSKSKLVYKALPHDDPTQRQPNITRAKENLGWEPKIKLEEGLIKTIAYFEDLVNKQ